MSLQNSRHRAGEEPQPVRLADRGTTLLDRVVVERAPSRAGRQCPPRRWCWNQRAAPPANCNTGAHSHDKMGDEHTTLTFGTNLGALACPRLLRQAASRLFGSEDHRVLRHRFGAAVARGATGQHPSRRSGPLLRMRARLPPITPGMPGLGPRVRCRPRRLPARAVGRTGGGRSSGWT